MFRTLYSKLAAVLLACRRDRPAPPSVEAGAQAGEAPPNAASAVPPIPSALASSAATDDAATPPASGAASVADMPARLGPSRPSAIMQCKSSALARDAAIGLVDDRALGCPLAIGDRSQRPPWRGALDGTLTRERRAVAGVAKDDCCYAMSSSTGSHRPR